MRNDLIDYLNELEKLFDNAATKEEKQAVVTGRFNFSSLESIKDKTFIIKPPILSPQDRLEHFNALALAVALGKVDVVKKMLSVFDKESINDPQNFVWGFRQPYTFMHFAAHPLVEEHFADTNNFFRADDHIAIIHLLAACGADPNLVIEGSVYRNPPLAGGWMTTHFDNRQLLKIRAALVLMGADPKLHGSSFELSPKEIAAILKEASSQYILASDELRAQISENILPENEEKIIVILQAGLAQLKARTPENENAPTPRFF